MFRKYYDGVVRFSQTDPDVLTPSRAVQMTKVLTGRYAILVGSDTVVTQWRAAFCDVTGIRVSGTHKQFVFYLQKDSPYTPLFSGV